MIKRLYIDNFKALNKFEIDLRPFTVIVGNNTAGKSTILQVIGFLTSIVTEDFSVALERRGWEVADMKSKLSKSAKILFYCDMEIPILTESVSVRWELVLNAYTQKNILELSSEKIFCGNGKEREEILSCVPYKECYIKDKNGEKLEFPSHLDISSSFLKMLSQTEDNKRNYPVVMEMKRFLTESDSFELLSPEKMRLSSRGDAQTIGSAGDKLPSFIKSMTKQQKEGFQEKIQRIFGNRVTAIEAQARGRAGWTHIISHEKYLDKTIAIKSKNMSDGMLRLLAFLAISEIDKNHIVMLLDEIENGINLDYAESLIKILRQIYSEKKNQLIVTTHSTIFLDYVDKDDIVYLYRDPETGNTRAVSLFGQAAFLEKLEYLFPGEVFMNMNNEMIINTLLNSGKSEGENGG